ncbi:MAG: hypothetical protein RXO30_09460 [Thermoproteus sp.]
MTLFVLDLGRDLSALGNVVLGGFGRVRYVVFKQVGRGFRALRTGSPGGFGHN